MRLAIGPTQIEYQRDADLMPCQCGKPATSWIKPSQGMNDTYCDECAARFVYRLRIGPNGRLYGIKPITA